MLSEVRRIYPRKPRRRWLHAEGRRGLTSLILTGDDNDANDKFNTEAFLEVPL
jgi:hypothetical protein